MFTLMPKGRGRKEVMGKASQEEERASAKALRLETVSRKENSVTRYYPIIIPKESLKNTARPGILGLSEPQEGWLIPRLWQKLGKILGQEQKIGLLS